MTPDAMAGERVAAICTPSLLSAHRALARPMRQGNEILDALGITPKRLLTADDLDGLPLPDGVW